mgnify:CR=1 FL=1
MSISAIIFTAVMRKNVMLINWVRKALAALSLINFLLFSDLDIYIATAIATAKNSPYLRLTAETKIDVPDGTSLGFKPPAFNSFKII